MTSTNAPEAVKTNAGVAYVTSFRTHFVQLMDYVKECVSDDQAKNAWSSICAIEIGLLGQISRNPKIQSEFDIDPLAIEDAKVLIKRWSSGVITRIEKTTFVRHESDGGEPTYMVCWDSYQPECGYAELKTMTDIIEREKQSQMVQRLIQFSGECLSLIMGLGLLKLDDTIAQPFKPDESYSESKMADDMSRRRLPIRPNLPRPR